MCLFLLIYALAQFEYLLSSWYMKIDFNQFITWVYYFGSERSDVAPELHSCETTSYKCNFERLHIFKTVWKNSSRFNLPKLIPPDAGYFLEKQNVFI